MENIEILRRYGLFDARVPRYTSYPPANHFQDGAGARHQDAWLSAVPDGTELSIYVHIPFCKRLCWFCACRTQGTSTLRPVEAYLAVLRHEIDMVRARLPRSVRMGRLHLGGGTPTILTDDGMRSLLLALQTAFPPAEDFEFSVEIDPTEVTDSLLRTLLAHGLNRASLGVQDFDPAVQDAIGRHQSHAETRHVVDVLRSEGLQSLNIDLLYGLPHQTALGFGKTLDSVIDLGPDRLAIYGYAHVPWMSKRQVMIRDETLPGNTDRYLLARQAEAAFTDAGYDTIGIDHFARPTDSLSQAAREGRLRRNFQGYTDDGSPTLIGLGASAISRFPQGYVQNAPATSTYQERIGRDRLAGAKGYAMTAEDGVIARMVEDLMCRFALSEVALCEDFPQSWAFIRRTIRNLRQAFPHAFTGTQGDIALTEEARPLARIVAHRIDGCASRGLAHSVAV